VSPVRAQLTLSAFLHPAGQPAAAWHPDAHRSGGFDHYRKLATIAEKGLFDFLFLSDAEGVRPHDEEVISHASKGFADQFEPFTLLSALSTCTERIGLVATASTSFHEPYHVARKLASLDRLSAGRAGWHVTVAQETFEIENFGPGSILSRSARFARAAEFIDVVTGLWRGEPPPPYPDEAAIIPPGAGPSQRVALHHQGPHFSVRGPLNISRTPQARPVVATAVSSGATQALALRSADIVFTPQSSLLEARDFYADFKARAQALGRDPAHVRILPDVFAVVGGSESEARERYEQLQPAFEGGDSLALLSRCLDANRRGFALDGPLPPLADVDGGDMPTLVEQASYAHMTIREIYLRIAGARGHWTLVGTPRSIADELESWFREGAADGFNLVPPALPDSLGDFVELVVPELQRRGLFRTQYTGATLRDHLGLPTGPR
jgi:FMN-dependent oxidoreductase (nitrilotriacetate monooxygenase family)